MSLGQVKLKKGHIIFKVLCLGESFSGTNIEIERVFGKPDKSYKNVFPSNRDHNLHLCISLGTLYQEFTCL